MMTQFKILLFIFILNVVAGLVMNAQTGGTYFIAGTQYMHGLNATSDTDTFESELNATDIAGNWQATPFSGIPVIGDIFAGLNLLVKNLKFLFTGFSSMLQWVGTFIPSSGGRTALNLIAAALNAVFGLMCVTLVIEMISGRQLLP